jgi:type II secretory pathway pseudopilin PulG
MHQVQVRRSDEGYAMAALLVAMAVMAVMMSIAMPVWRQAAQREKEAELVWRGQQYDRALQLFRRKTSAPGPPNLDILIDQKFLRKKYKDPITGGDFDLKPVGAIGPGTERPGLPGGAAGASRPGRVVGSTFGSQRTGAGSQTSGPGNQTSGPGNQTSGAGNQTGNQTIGAGNRTTGAGTQSEAGAAGQPESGEPNETVSPFGQRAFGQLIGGVRSKSKARSIRELNGRTRYDQWEFVYVPYNPNPQPPAAGAARPGQQPRTRTQRAPGMTPSTPRSGPTGSGPTGSGVQ